MSKVMIGTDIEFFLENKEGAVVSAEGIVDGTKNVPFKITENCSTQLDNVSLELTVPPSIEEVDFVNVVTSAIADAKAHLGYNISKKASHEFEDRKSVV